MTAVRFPSWAVSFADLAFLLLGCFVLITALKAPNASAAASDGAQVAAAELFEPGEARLTAAGAARLAALARDGKAVIVSRGEDGGGSRYDGFELAAARAAAAGRALSREGGTPAEIRVEPAPGEPQRLAISFR